MLHKVNNLKQIIWIGLQKTKSQMRPWTHLWGHADLDNIFEIYISKSSMIWLDLTLDKHITIVLEGLALLIWTLWNQVQRPN